MMIRRYNAWATAEELEAVADAMMARPFSLEAHIGDRSSLVEDLRRYLTEGTRYLGAFDRGNGDEAWVRCAPFFEGDEAVVHLVGRQGGHFDDDVMAEGVNHLIETFFVAYDMRRMLFPVIDVPGYPLLEKAERIFAAAGLVREGLLRKGAYNQHLPVPCDLHLWGVLREDRR